MTFGPCLVSRRSAGAILLLLVTALALRGFAPLPAQESAMAAVDPREFGFDLPPGPLRRDEEKAVTTTDSDGRAIVGRVHVAVGDSAIVLTPDGQLVARRAGAFAPTDRKFEPADKTALANDLTAREFNGFKSRQTRHYIFAYNTSEEFALATSRILETMLPGVKEYTSAQKITVHEPQVPLVVIMFKTEEEFQRHRRMPAGVVAYYHPVSNRVFMYEQSRLADVRPDLAIQQSIATIAHEGAHQVLHNIGVQQRLSIWPMWLSEGLAEYFAPTSTGARLKWKGAGQVNDMRMFELEQYVKSRASEKPDGAMIAQTVLAGQLTSTGYASAWALTHYLAKNRRTEFNQYVREVSKLGPLEAAGSIAPPGIVRKNQELFLKAFGDDIASMEMRLVAHLKKQTYTDPFANLPHYVATVVYSNGKRTQRELHTFHSPSLADKWIRETISKAPEEQREAAAPTIRRFPNRALAETYARQWLGDK